MPADDNSAALARLVEQGIRIPPQPKVLVELRAQLASGKYTIRSVAQTIAHDPGLVAFLYQKARLPVFSGRGEAESLEELISLLGVNETVDLLKASALTTVINDDKRKAFDVYWARAEEMAQLAALIAEDLVSVCNVFPEQAYMAAIFHECGVPILMLRFPKYCETMRLDTVGSWPDRTLEDERFATDHCSVGYLVARHWGLPDFVCKAILHHHEMPREELGATATLIAILQLAIHFYRRLNNQRNPVWPQIGARVLDEIGIPQRDEADYYEEICRRFLDNESTASLLFKEKELAF